MTIEKIRLAVEATPARSAWDKAVKQYALEILEGLPDSTEFIGTPEDQKTLLNGAANWNEYSYEGNSLIYDFDIAERICIPSELERCRGGELMPNPRETWLDAQARALTQAAGLIRTLVWPK